MVGNRLLASKSNGCNVAFVISQKQRRFFLPVFQHWFKVYFSSPTLVMEGGVSPLYLWNLTWFWPLQSPRYLVPLFLYGVSTIHCNGIKRCEFTRKPHLSLYFMDTKSDPWPPQQYRLGEHSSKRVGTWISSVEALDNSGSGCTRPNEDFLGVVVHEGRCLYTEIAQHLIRASLAD